jgi:hypothetical protein
MADGEIAADVAAVTRSILRFNHVIAVHSRPLPF